MTPPLPTDKYKFDREFQRSVLAVSVRNPTFLQSFRTAVDAQYLEDLTHETIASCVLDHYDKYGVAPALPSLKEALRQTGACDTDKDKALTRLITEAIDLFRLQIPDEKFVIRTAVDFGKHQAVRQAIMDGAARLAFAGADYDKIVEQVARAARVGDDQRDVGRRYLAQRADRKGRTALSKLGQPIPTGWRSIDTAMKGGAYPGQLIVVAAPPKRGKSLTLVNIAATGVLLGKVVFFITCELLEPVIEERLDQRIMGLSAEEVQKQWPALESRLALLQQKKGEAFVKFYPMKTATVRQVRDYVGRMCNEHHITKPDLVIVDYGSLLKPAKGSNKNAQKHELSGGIYADLKGLAGELVCPVWTAQQCNRSAVNKKLVTEADLQETFETAGVCDLMFAMCQDDEELLARKMRMFIALNRVGPAGESVKMHADKERQILREDDRVAA